MAVTFGLGALLVNALHSPFVPRAGPDFERELGLSWSCLLFTLQLKAKGRALRPSAPLLLHILKKILLSFVLCIRFISVDIVLTRNEAW